MGRTCSNQVRRREGVYSDAFRVVQEGGENHTGKKRRRDVKAGARTTKISSELVLLLMDTSIVGVGSKRRPCMRGDAGVGRV